MLAAPARTQRFLEIVQIVLAFVSVCAVVDATRIPAPLDARAGYHSSVPQGREESIDQRLTDLARAERKRREAEQQANVRKLGAERSHIITLG